MCDDSNNQIIPIEQLKGKNEITFSEKIASVPKKTSDKIKNSLIKNAVINTETGETGIAVKAITTVLHTDSEGAKDYLLNQPKEVFFENNDGVMFITTPTLIGETSKRAEQPRAATQRDYLRQSRAYLTDISDSSIADRSRDHHLKQLEGEMKIAKKNAKREALEQGKLDPSKDIDVHHKESVSSNPRKMADPNNLDPIYREIHQEWHNKGGGTPEEWEKFKKSKGY
jgi:hypothetical protein